jgi:hypothetical protein
VRRRGLERRRGGTGIAAAAVLAVRDQHDVDRLLLALAAADDLRQGPDGIGKRGVVAEPDAAEPVQQPFALAWRVVAVALRRAAGVEAHQAEHDVVGGRLDHLGQRPSGDLDPVDLGRVVDRALQRLALAQDRLVLLLQ